MGDGKQRSRPGDRTASHKLSAPARNTEASITRGIGEPEPYQVMPSLAEPEYEALKASIAAGYDPSKPIVVDEKGAVLDGHHRRRVCAELGVTPPTITLPGLTEDQKHDYAMRANLACRHLTRLQKRDLIRDELERDPGRSDREIGRLCGADHKTVATVRLNGEFPQTGRWQRRAESSAEERLADSAARILELHDHTESERAAARACAGYWRETWTQVVPAIRTCAEAWGPVIVEHTGYENVWDWLQHSDIADGWHKLVEGVGYLQDLSEFHAAWFGTDSEPITPLVAEVELLLQGGTR